MGSSRLSSAPYSIISATDNRDHTTTCVIEVVGHDWGGGRDGAILLRPAMGMLVAGLRAVAADGIFNLDGTRLLKYERSLDRVVLSQWMFELHEHDVGRAWLEFDSFARRD